MKICFQNISLKIMIIQKNRKDNYGHQVIISIYNFAKHKKFTGLHVFIVIYITKEPRQASDFHPPPK